MNSDLRKIFKKYKGLWVAMDETHTTVVASGKDAQKAFDEAVDKGYAVPTMFKVPKENLPYVG